MYFVITLTPTHASSPETQEDKCQRHLKECSMNMSSGKSEEDLSSKSVSSLTEFQQLEQRANDGDLDAKFDLGVALLMGGHNDRAVKADRPRAKLLFQEVLNSGKLKYRVDALFHIGNIVDIVEHNREQGKSYFLESGIQALKNYFSSEKNNKDAVFVLFKDYFFNVVAKEENPLAYADFYEIIWEDFLKPKNIWHIHLSWKNYFDTLGKPLVYDNK